MSHSMLVYVYATPKENTSGEEMLRIVQELEEELEIIGKIRSDQRPPSSWESPWTLVPMSHITEECVAELVEKYKDKAGIYVALNHVDEPDIEISTVEV